MLEMGFHVLLEDDYIIYIRGMSATFKQRALYLVLSEKQSGSLLTQN